MDKQLLSSFIQKYSLGGAIESVIWEANDKSVKAKIISDDKSMIGEVVMHDSISKEFSGKKLGVFKTSGLVKLLSSIDDKIEVSLGVVGDKAISIKATDGVGKFNFALSDLAVIQNVPPMKYTPSDYQVRIKITDDFISRYSRSKAALPEVVSFTFHATDKKVEFVLGQTDVNTNNAYISAEVVKTEAIDKLSFNANVFKEILVANKGSEAEMSVSAEGLAKLEFKTDNFTSTYYLVAKVS